MIKDPDLGMSRLTDTPADVGHIKNNYGVISTNYDFTNHPNITTDDKPYQDKTHYQM